MKKATLLSALALFAVLGAFGAVYKFYFEKKLQAYDADKATQTQLRAALENLETKFAKVRPDVLISAWRQQVIPWTQALENRSKFFHFEDWEVHPEIPEEGPILKFWYKDKSDEVLREAYEKAAAELKSYYNLPPEQALRQQWGVPASDQWQDRLADRKEVENALKKLGFGVSALNFLIENNVRTIQQMNVWPRDKAAGGQRVTKQNLGLSFTITTEDFVEFMENLRTADRYFNVEALRVTYPYIAYTDEPELNVEMILSQAQYVEPAGGGAGAGAGAGAVVAAGAGAANPAAALTGMLGGQAGAMPANMPDFMRNMFGGMGGAAPPPKKQSIFSSAWRWFKRHILFTN